MPVQWSSWSSPVQWSSWSLSRQFPARRYGRWMVTVVAVVFIVAGIFWQLLLLLLFFFFSCSCVCLNTSIDQQVSASTKKDNVTGLVVLIYYSNYCTDIQLDLLSCLVGALRPVNHKRIISGPKKIFIQKYILERTKQNKTKRKQK